LDAFEVPVGSYEPSRGQHRAEALVELARREAGDRILAVTPTSRCSGEAQFPPILDVPEPSSA
jgi:hypothetical protein